MPKLTVLLVLFMTTSLASPGPSNEAQPLNEAQPPDEAHPLNETQPSAHRIDISGQPAYELLWSSINSGARLTSQASLSGIGAEGDVFSIENSVGFIAAGISESEELTIDFGPPRDITEILVDDFETGTTCAWALPTPCIQSLEP